MLEILATHIVLEVVPYTAAGAHAGTGHDDGTAVDTVDRNGFGGLPGEMQSWQSERVMSLLKHLSGRRLKTLRMVSKDLCG